MELAIPAEPDGSGSTDPLPLIGQDGEQQ